MALYTPSGLLVGKSQLNDMYVLALSLLFFVMLGKIGNLFASAFQSFVKRWGRTREPL